MNLKSKIRSFLFRTVHVLSFLSDKLIACGYFIRSSRWFVEADVSSFQSRRDIYNYMIEKEGLAEQQLSYLEFGVSKGWGFHTWYRINKNPASRFIGFDTFEGIPEAWGNEEKGSYTAEGKPPEIDEGESRASFVIGLFQDTLDDFMSDFDRGDSRLVILMDADLYNATLFVLLRLGPILKKGDIIVFDEFFSVTKAHTEFRAFLDYLHVEKLNYQAYAKGNNEFVVVID